MKGALKSNIICPLSNAKIWFLFDVQSEFVVVFLFVRNSSLKELWQMLSWSPCLTSIVIYHVLHSLADSPRGVCWDFLLWPTVKRLEWNGLSQVVWAVGRWGHCCDSEVWATMQQKYPLHCELLSSFRSHSTSSPQCKSFLFSIPAVCLSVRHRTSSKGFGVGIEEDCGGRQGGRGERREKSAVTVVGGNAKQGSMPWVGKGA